MVHPLKLQWERMTDLLGKTINTCGPENTTQVIRAWIVHCGPLAVQINNDLSQLEPNRKRTEAIALKPPRSVQALAFQIAFCR